MADLTPRDDIKKAVSEILKRVDQLLKAGELDAAVQQIAKAKETLAKHGMDAMILFAEENKYYYGGYRDAALMFTDRWRHCFIVSQEHDTVFVGESVLDNNVNKTTWVKDARFWCGIKAWRLPLKFNNLLWIWGGDFDKIIPNTGNTYR